MEQWNDQAIVLSARSHGEGGAVVSLLTHDHGRHAGYVRGASSSKMRGVLEPGTFVTANWSARVSDSLGSYRIEQEAQVAAVLMGDSLRLGALLAACSLCDAALPEREGHSGLYEGMRALLEGLENDLWGVSYVLWEIALLRELGFGLDFSRCAGGGDQNDLLYISPKTGRAVSRVAGEPYQDKLLLLPDFVTPGGRNVSPEEIMTGLEMTGYFLENWVFAHHSHGVPQDRLRFGARFAKYVGRLKPDEESNGRAICHNIHEPAL